MLAVMDATNPHRPFVECIVNSKLIIKAIAAIAAELGYRGISYSPGYEERILLRTLLRRSHNSIKKGGTSSLTLDEYVDAWLKQGLPIHDWLIAN